MHNHGKIIGEFCLGSHGLRRSERTINELEARTGHRELAEDSSKWGWNTSYNLRGAKSKKPLKHAGGAQWSLGLIESSIILTKSLKNLHILTMI
jgi:hypothetical protein